jgi:mono/diheme cytochrome c family protein
MSIGYTRTCSGGQRGRFLLTLVGLWYVILASAGVCAEPRAKAATQPPAELRTGEAKFRAQCARCHGEGGIGTKQGPPLVHKIYEPSHHGDLAFQQAAANGVRAHHWNFGDMPRIEGVTSDDVAQITQYVRWLQHQAGIM